MDDLDFEISKEFERIDTNKIISEMDARVNKELNSNDIELEKLRDLNHLNYFELKIDKIKDLPIQYETEALEIFDLYNTIDSITLLKENFSSAKEHSNLIKTIKKRIESLEEKLSIDLDKIIEENDKLEKDLDLSILKDTNPNTESQRKIIDERINSLKFFNLSTNTKNPGFEISRQEKRKKYIDEIREMILTYDKNLIKNRKQNELKEINKEIELKYEEYLDKIDNLKKYIKVNKNFDNLIKKINEIFDYDKNDYEDANYLLNDVIFNKRIDKELEKYNKILKDVTNPTLKMKETPNELKDTIKNNYVNLLTEKEIQELNDNKYLIKLKQILDKIWKNEITNVENYTEGNNFKFLCSNLNEYKKEIIVKLITSEELKYLNDFGDYKVGYIYEFNDNIKSILYNNSDSFDKTPIDLEAILINQKEFPEIKLYLNSRKQAVFYIKNEDFNEEYEMANKLSNEENLPLIVIDLEKYKNR